MLQVFIAFTLLGATLWAAPAIGKALQPGNWCQANVDAPPDLQIKDCTALIESIRRPPGSLSGIYLI
jgi:hypothetical protein